MVTDPIISLPQIDLQRQRGYRLINSKFPPIALFDDVADEHEFQALYDLQSLTNPRLNNAIGCLTRLPTSAIPFGIPGCSYAVAPFTHVTPQGSRFADGRFGVLYIADDMATALSEVAYHHERYWRKVEGLKYDRLVMRGLVFTFSASPAYDALELSADDPIYHPVDYSESRRLGARLRAAGVGALRYRSVRRPGAVCYALFTPKGVSSVHQTAHYELIWDGRHIKNIDKILSTHLHRVPDPHPIAE